jgi:glutaredoxin
MSRLLIIVLLIVGAYMWKHYDIGHFFLADEWDESSIASLAAAVQPGDIVMYSTTSCTYCAQAGAWMERNGFAFTECDMNKESHCENEFLAYGGTGTPYLVVRGHHMKDGFNSDEFLAAMQR